MTNTFEEIELTRYTMPEGTGGLFDSLPNAKRNQMESDFLHSLAFLRGFPRHEVTRALVKNAQLAESMNRSVRLDAMQRLLETLVRLDAAIGIDDFMKSYS